MRGLRTLAACFAAVLYMSAVAADAPAALSSHILVLKTPGLGTLARGTTLDASAEYTLGANGPCAISYTGSLTSNGLAEDVARLGLNPPEPCGAGQTQPAGSPWTFKFGAGRKLSVTGPKTLVIDRGEPLHCVYEARNAVGRLRSLKPLAGRAEATLQPNKKLSSPKCARNQRLVFVLTQLLARNEGNGMREAVEGEIH
jgi:hypothetical protein